MDIENIAKTNGLSVEGLKAKAEVVLTENMAAWASLGEDVKKERSMRIALRQMVHENKKLAQSGCVQYEGCFVHVPRMTDYAEMGYKKLQKELAALPEPAVIDALVAGGRIEFFEADGEGVWTRHYNPSLSAGKSFEEYSDTLIVSQLPKEAVMVEGQTDQAFFRVWDNKSPTYPSGSKNYRYGKPEPKNRPEREAVFFGRKVGDKEFTFMTFRFDGELAKVQHPTYVPGTIAMYPGKDGTKAYAKRNVTSFTVDEGVAANFPSAPVEIGDEGTGGFMSEYLGDRLLSGLSDIGEFFDSVKDTKERWTAFCGAPVEVAHIEMDDRGNYVVVIGDLDMMSTATADIRVPAAQASDIDWGIGTVLFVVGSVWKTREDEMRFDCTGFYPVEKMVHDVGSEDGDVDQESPAGWDE